LSVVTFIVGAPPPGADAGTRWDPLSFVPLIALSIFGLMLVEQLYRRIEPAARWNMRPLVLAFAGIFAFDLVLFADAELFRFVDPHLWAARGMAHAFAIPLLALAACAIRTGLSASRCRAGCWRARPRWPGRPSICW
jgi:hypothetical protein